MIKTQQDVKESEKLKKTVVAEKMASKVEPVTESKETPVDDILGVSDVIDILNSRISEIERYLEEASVVIKSVEHSSDDIYSLQTSSGALNGEISKLIGDLIRFSKLEDERYKELSFAINTVNDKLTTLDSIIPTFVDKRIDEKMGSVNKADQPA